MVEKELLWGGIFVLYILPFGVWQWVAYDRIWNAPKTQAETPDERRFRNISLLWCLGLITLAIGWKQSWPPLAVVAVVLLELALGFGAYALLRRFRLRKASVARSGARSTSRLTPTTSAGRLAALLTVAAFVGFGTSALYAYYETSVAQRTARTWYDLVRTGGIECSRNRASIYCEMLESNRQAFDEAIEVRDAWVRRTEALTLLAVVTPAGLVLIFFSTRWVLTGRTRTTKESPEHEVPG